MNDEGEHTVARWLGTQAYAVTATAMRDWTSGRRPNTFDELWFLEHPKTYTLGRAGKREHVIGDIGEIPLVESDRGGQVTYHGPGQLIAYTLVDVSRLGGSVRTMVQGLEQAVIEQLRALNIDAHRIEGAPGVYVSDAKIAALGLRVSRGRAFHGLSLNVDLDLSPFCAINPCGYEGLKVTRLKDLGVEVTVFELARSLCQHLCATLVLAKVSPLMPASGWTGEKWV